MYMLLTIDEIIPGAGYSPVRMVIIFIIEIIDAKLKVVVFDLKDGDQLIINFYSFMNRICNIGFKCQSS